MCGARGRALPRDEEPHRIRTAQADLLLDHLGDRRRTDRLVDAGSGRGDPLPTAYEAGSLPHPMIVADRI